VPWGEEAHAFPPSEEGEKPIIRIKVPVEYHCKGGARISEGESTVDAVGTTHRRVQVHRCTGAQHMIFALVGAAGGTKHTSACKWIERVCKVGLGSGAFRLT
jgi:hypothetical protein